MSERGFTASAAAAIRTFDGETPLQVLARSGDPVPSALSSLERFPYYTAFPFAWYYAAMSGDVAPGSVRSLRYLARDLVLWRDSQGRAHVVDAYCPHLGAHLGFGGRVEGDHLVCPYHWWEYDAEGRNVKVPYSERTNAKARLRTYPTIERAGMILFWYHPVEGTAPLWDIPEFPEYDNGAWGVPLIANWEVRCPWQELAENAPDYIHLRTVHGAATVPVVDELTYDGYGSRLRSAVDFSTPRGPQPGRIDTDGFGPGFSIARFSGIIDTIFFAGTTPIDWETTLSVKAYRVRVAPDDAADSVTDERAAKAQRVGKALVRDLRKQMAEDNVIFDHKVFNARPALAPGDGPILEFRKWASQFYVDGDPIAASRVGSRGVSLG